MAKYRPSLMVAQFVVHQHGPNQGQVSGNPLTRALRQRPAAGGRRVTTRSASRSGLARRHRFSDPVPSVIGRTLLSDIGPTPRRNQAR